MTLTRQLATHGHARQLAASAAADRIGNATDRALGAVWRGLMSILRTHTQGATAFMEARHLLRGTLPALDAVLADGLAGLATEAHEHSAKALARTLPANYLAAALAQKGNVHRVRESRDVMEAGLLQFALDAAGLRIDMPMDAIPTDETAARNLIQSLLFPPPDRLSVYRIVRGLQINGQTWEQRLRGTVSARFSPNILAGIISLGYSQGKDVKAIAQDLRPAMEGIRTSAKRLARTYGMAIAHHTQQQTADQLGDLVIGWTIHSVHGNPNSRPWHVARDGTEYFKEPEPWQKGLAQLPHPPLEAADPAERPKGAPHIAWNCLCYATPILRPLG
jgi:hypothetical protein